MRLKDNELVKRYIYYLQRYISYDEQENAKEDLLELLYKRLPTNYTEEELKRELNRLGNPYSFAKHYDKSQNIFLSGRSYDIFVLLAKTIGISAVCALILFILNYFPRLLRIPAIEVIVSLSVTTFAMALIPSWICERIKRTKMMASLLKEWSTDELFYRRKFRLDPKNYLFIIAYSTLFIMQLLYIKTGDFSKTLHFIIGFMFFLNVLRDAIMLSEKNYYNYVLYFAVAVDILVPLLLMLFSAKFMPRTGIVMSIVFLELFDLLKLGIRFFFDKK